MSSIIKSSGCLLASAFVLGLPPYSAAAVYTCISASGGKIYTSERTSACEADDLPRIGSYQGYRLKEAKAKPEKRKTKAARQSRSSGRGTKPIPAKNKRPSEKGRGYSGFPATDN